MKPGILISSVITGCIILFGSQLTWAHQAGDILLRVGAVTVSPNDDSGAVSNLPDGVNNAQVEVDSNTQLGLTGAYMLTDHIGIELLAATPFSHEATGAGDIAGVKVGKTKDLPPTLSVQYYFGGKDWRVNPYVGVGVNATIFFDEETDQELINVLNTLPTIAALGGINSVDMDLDMSWGLAGQVGLDIAITDNWLLNAALWYIDIDTTATLKTDLGTEHEVDVDIDPWVFFVAVAYRF